MLTADKCRDYAAQCKALGLTDVFGERAVRQTIMSVKWSALADKIDRDNLRATAVAFALRRSHANGRS
jgi:hypothetical protein